MAPLLLYLVVQLPGQPAIIVCSSDVLVLLYDKHLMLLQGVGILVNTSTSGKRQAADHNLPRLQLLAFAGLRTSHQGRQHCESCSPHQNNTRTTQEHTSMRR